MTELLGVQLPEVAIQTPFATGLFLVLLYKLYRRKKGKPSPDDQAAQIFFLGAIIPAAINLVWTGLFGNPILVLNEIEKAFYLGFGGLLILASSWKEIKKKFFEE